MKVHFSLFFLLFFSLYCPEIYCSEQFYSIPFLKNYTAVQNVLKNVGFKKIIFKTSDNFKLSGLFLSRHNATCNVIICAGWFPGRKEGMATFYDLLPDYCNILLFDARGRGESQGSFIWNIWRYGMDEYRDIVGAISWINHNNSLPIIVGGTCSGAFNAAHAIVHVIKNNLLEQTHVKGLFFDSGWGSVITMSQSSPIVHIKKYLSKCLLLAYGTKEIAQKNSFYTSCSSCIVSCFKIVHLLCISPVASHYEAITNLFDKIQVITIPILFIHSYDDTHAAFSQVKKLATLAPQKQCWWIEKSSHAKHHLIHKEEYKEKLIAFIDGIINECY